jgi:hypothetical protein
MIKALRELCLRGRLSQLIGPLPRIQPGTKIKLTRVFLGFRIESLVGIGGGEPVERSSLAYVCEGVNNQLGRWSKLLILHLISEA